MIQKEKSDWLLPALLSTTAGAVDVIGFLALGGLFTAHITGNLVILAAHYVTGRFGEIGPILSVPIFMLVLSVVTLAFVAVPSRVARRALLVLQAILLAAFLSFGVGFGPFSNPDSGMAVLVGMLGVAAMVTQNAVVRLTLHGSPSTAVMTTNTAQLAVDVATLIRNRDHHADFSQARRRAYLTLVSVLGFVLGLIIGAILETKFGLWSLTFPVILAVLAIPLGESWTASSDKVASHARVGSCVTTGPFAEEPPLLPPDGDDGASSWPRSAKGGLRSEDNRGRTSAASDSKPVDARLRFVRNGRASV